MRLRAVYQPVEDLGAAMRFYAGLGFEKAWGEDDEGVAAFAMPGTNAVLMLAEDRSDAGTGPLFVLPSVAAFYEQNKERLAFVEEPHAIGPGMLAGFTDPSGNLIRVMDDTTSRERS